jgi:hypothetical protein
MARGQRRVRPVGRDGGQHRQAEGTADLPRGVEHARGQSGLRRILRTVLDAARQSG